MIDSAEPFTAWRSALAVHTRRQALGLLAASAGLFGSAAAFAKEASKDPAKDAAKGADESILSEALVLRDPQIPVAGNPAGDITIVEYFDYQCPYCRKLEPELRQAVKDDGKVRLVFKDWPILGPVSVYAARLAQAARYQEKFIEAHDALIGLDVKLTEPGVRERLAKAGIDVDRAVRDLEANTAAIAAILKRNDDQAKAFGFEGTPAFIIGKFRVPGPLTREQFGLAIADARKAAKTKKPG